MQVDDRLDRLFQDAEKVRGMLDSYNLDNEEIELLLAMLENSSEDNNDIIEYLYNIDFDEVPVDIDTFIEHPDYLGGLLDKGDSVYPYWREKLRAIFSTKNKYQECIFSGSIGQGKSTIATIGMLYILHNLLCLRRPNTYYNLTKSSVIALAVLNITLDAAYGVGYRMLMDMLKESPWFLRHGKLKGSKGNEVYVPGKGIEIIVGSKPSHTIGRDVFCMVGDTEVLTDEGYFTLEDLDGRNDFRVATMNDEGEIQWNEHHIGSQLAGLVDELYDIELENGTIVTVTADHQFMTNRGWVEAKNLTEDDELVTFAEVR